MALDFYYLSGSPFAWKVWLALEHKQIPYTLQVLSADAGDLKAEAFTSFNPRGKAPTIVHDGFALYESAAIIEYLNEQFAGQSLWPQDVRDRARARRLMAESDAYTYPPIRRAVEEMLLKGGEAPDAGAMTAAREATGRNLALFAQAMKGDFLAGDTPSAADYSLYPLTAILRRLDARNPEFDLRSAIPERIEAWRSRIEALGYFKKTLPPHWRQ